MQTQPIQGFDPSPIMFPEYSRARTFTRLDNPHIATKSVWQQELDAGAVTVDEFFDKLNALIDQWPDA